MKFVPLSEELLEHESSRQLRRAWPELVFHDTVSTCTGAGSTTSGLSSSSVGGRRPLLAEGNSVPVAGMPASWRDAFPNAFDSGEEPDRLCALQILVDPDLQGRGLSRVMLEHMRGLAHARGWESCAGAADAEAPVPLDPIERYVEWRRDDGLLFDPWLARTSGWARS